MQSISHGEYLNISRFLVCMMIAHVFRKYDIRGLFQKELDETFAEELGKAVGTCVGTQKTICVGMDNRKSSPLLKQALIRGLLSAGCAILDIGVVPTPLLYYSLFLYQADGGVMVTASHLPKEYNGFKICKGKEAIYGEEIQNIRKLMESKKYYKGSGTVQEREVIPQYISEIKKRIKLKRKMDVVVDSGNGCGGLVAPQLLRALGCTVTELFSQPDGDFPNHVPDPTLPNEYLLLQQKMREGTHDAGIAYDCDCDRLGVINKEGKMMYGDQLMILFSRELLKKRKGEKILVEVKCSNALVDEILKHGGIPIMCETGHSLIKEAMKRENALISGEMSGHLFFRDEYYGFDDGIYASCRLLRLLSEQEKDLSELLADAPRYYSSPEIRVECPEEKKFFVVGNLTKELKQEYDVMDIDGVRFTAKDGWGLIRASNTESVIVVRYEAKSQKGLQEIRDLLSKKIKKFGLTLPR